MKKHAQYLLLIIGLLVHLASIPLLDIDPVAGDAKQFNKEAENIKNGIGWINTEGPGKATATYPSQVIFLLIVKYIFGEYNIYAAVIIQHLMVLATALMVYLTSIMIFKQKNVALLAESLVIFFPHMIQSANVLNTHTLSMFLGVTGIYLLMRKEIKTIVYIGIGAVWALATMARFTYQFFVPLYILVFLIRYLRERKKKKLRILLKPLLFIIGFVLLILPWQIRVARADAGPYGYSGPWRICYAFNRSPENRSNDRDEFEMELAEKKLPLGEKDEIYRKKVISNFKNNPEWFLNNWLMNLSFLLVNLSTVKQPHISIYAGIYYSMLLAFGFIGIVSMNREQILQYLPAIILLLVIFGVHVPIYGYISKSFPLWALFSPIVARGFVLSFAAARRDKKGMNDYEERYR
ncbi:MAG: hypothetical protein GF417_12005 [Candidatus Latescibacteria bacterium]|nr:hypothetical protein [bacterium]MBD3425150.1 hypothetical protein [Candidatus Latescibacterota bacterium]